ncbi:MFS transporter [Mitsuaria sp. CC2]|uniref:MFS transporter n=1 Tax=Mitsuaria sp. CC2 TaxID=3029186 RepID=UPI003BA1A582
MAALLALAMTGFICIVTETLPAGLLPQVGAGMGVSQALAGQLVTAYALGSLIAAIPLTILTRRWSRRRVLLLTLVGFLLFNTVTAASARLVAERRGLEQRHCRWRRPGRRAARFVGGRRHSRGR